MFELTQHPDLNLHVATFQGGRAQRHHLGALVTHQTHPDRARDYTAGLLTMSELRDKLRQVHSNGQVADSARVRNASRDMLASITQGDLDALSRSIGEMGSACTAAGY